MEEVLGEDLGWRTVSCIYEDYVDPAHVIELTSPENKGREGQHVVKDLKKNLMRAEKYKIQVKEIKGGQWTVEDRQEVERGIEEWKQSRSGIQIASTTLQPWLDEEHRRYWVAKRENEKVMFSQILPVVSKLTLVLKIVGILILTPVRSNSWQIKNAVSFPDAPKGTSEALIFQALKDLNDEQISSVPQGAAGNETESNGTPSDHTPTHEAPSRPSSITVEPSTSKSELGKFPDISSSSTPRTLSPINDSALEDESRITVTFGISASPELHPVHNLGGWKVKALGKTYKKVAASAKLINRGEFRVSFSSLRFLQINMLKSVMQRKFDSEHQPMYVCYPEDGFGLDGVNTLFKLLKK